MSNKASYTPPNFPTDLPTLSNAEGSAEGEEPTVEQKGKLVRRTQGYRPPQYETAAEISARVQSTKEVKGNNSGKKIVRKTF